MLVTPVECDLWVKESQLESFNAWLARRIARHAGPVRDVCLWHGMDDSAATDTARYLARSGTQRLLLLSLDSSVWPTLLAAVCSIRSLTSLSFSFRGPARDLVLLDALGQLQSLCLDFMAGGYDATPSATWGPQLASLTELSLTEVTALTVSLDGCSTLQRLSAVECDGVKLAARAPLQQLTRLYLMGLADGVQIPWQRMHGLRELLMHQGPSASFLEGITHITALQSLLLSMRPSSVPLPPGPWLAGVTRLLLQDFQCKEVGGGVERAARMWRKHTVAVTPVAAWNTGRLPWAASCCWMNAAFPTRGVN